MFSSVQTAWISPLVFWALKKGACGPVTHSPQVTMSAAIKLHFSSNAELTILNSIYPKTIHNTEQSPKPCLSCPVPVELYLVKQSILDDTCSSQVQDAYQYQFWLTFDISAMVCLVIRCFQSPKVHIGDPYIAKVQ